MDYVFTCDACGLVEEIDDVSISNLAPLPHGWRRITFAFPADSKGEETSLFADHWESEIGEEICPACFRLLRRILSSPTLAKSLHDQEENEKEAKGKAME